MWRVLESFVAFVLFTRVKDVFLSLSTSFPFRTVVFLPVLLRRWALDGSLCEQMCCQESVCPSVGRHVAACTVPSVAQAMGAGHQTPRTHAFGLCGRVGTLLLFLLPGGTVCPLELEAQLSSGGSGHLVSAALLELPPPWCCSGAMLSPQFPTPPGPGAAAKGISAQSPAKSSGFELNGAVLRQPRPKLGVLFPSCRVAGERAGARRGL